MRRITRLILLVILFTWPVTILGQFGGKSITLKSAQEVHILKKGVFLRIYAHDGERLAVGYLRKIRDNSVTVGSFIKGEEIDYGQIGKITISARARIHHNGKKYARFGYALGLLVGYAWATWDMRDFEGDDDIFKDLEFLTYTTLSGSFGAISGYVLGFGTGIHQLNEDQEYIVGPGEWQIQR